MGYSWGTSGPGVPLGMTAAALEHDRAARQARVAAVVAALRRAVRRSAPRRRPTVEVAP